MLATLAATRSDDLRQTFAVPPEGRLWRELAELDADTAALPYARASRPLSIVRARRAFGGLLDTVRPDAAIFHGSWVHAMFASTARERGCRIAFWQHAPIVRPHWPDRWATRTAPDLVIANSRFTAAAPAFPGHPAHVVYCPVAVPRPMSADERTSGRHALGAGEADVIVLMAARMEMFKGHHVLLEAARILDRGDVVVWIAGGVQDPREQSYFDRLARDSRGLRTRVSLLGHREDVPALMQLADVYCQPNAAPEPFGIAIAEAMLSSLPCVVSDAGGAAELVDRTCGVLTNCGDAAAVAQAIERLATDRAQRRAMGRAAAARACALVDPAQRLTQLHALFAGQPAHAG